MQLTPLLCVGSGQRVWHIVEELVNLNVLPQPSNPFEVSFAALEELPQLERMCMTVRSLPTPPVP